MSLPEFPVFPEFPEWDALLALFCERCKAFRGAVRQLKQSVSDWTETFCFLSAWRFQEVAVTTRSENISSLFLRPDDTPEL